MELSEKYALARDIRTNRVCKATGISKPDDTEYLVARLRKLSGSEIIHVLELVDRWGMKRTGF